MTHQLVGGLLATGHWSWLGAWLGAILAVGGLLIFVGAPVNRRPGLEARLAPYLRDTARPSRLLAVRREAGGPGWLLILDPVIHDLGRGVEQVLGGAASVRRRLQRAHRARLSRARPTSSTT